MRADVRLSTKFLTTQNAHQVGMLVTLTGETPVRRPPVNVALVLDRSGSMQGAPLAAAKEAAARFASFLTAADRLAIVAFDDEVRTIWGPRPAGDPAAVEAIRRVTEGGSTNLSGGWLQGVKHVQAGRVDGTNRVVLLTDGQANVGLVEPDQLVGLALAGAGKGVSTTCVGFGASFNEDLLAAMSREGGGNYWYVETAEQLAEIFAGEVEGLVALAAQNVEVAVTLSHPKAAGLTVLQSLPVETSNDAWSIRLGDLYATAPRAVGFLVHVEDVAELGAAELGQVRIDADVVTEAGIEHRTVTMPIVANLDGADHVEPEVERTFLRFAAAKAREEAVRLADAGDFSGAAERLHAASVGMVPYTDRPEVREEIDDLRAEAGRLAQRRYDAADRKYQAARAMASRDLKQQYLDRIRRRR